MCSQSPARPTKTALRVVNSIYFFLFARYLSKETRNLRIRHVNLFHPLSLNLSIKIVVEYQPRQPAENFSGFSHHVDYNNFWLILLLLQQQVVRVVTLCERENARPQGHVV